MEILVEIENIPKDVHELMSEDGYNVDHFAGLGLLVEFTSVPRTGDRLQLGFDFLLTAIVEQVTWGIELEPNERGDFVATEGRHELKCRYVSVAD